MALVRACEAVVCEKEEEVTAIELEWLGRIGYVFLVIFLPRLLAFVYLGACGKLRETVAGVRLHGGAPADGG